jgi:hypothetical protein
MSAVAAVCGATLLVIAGQSNALGFGLDRGDLPKQATADPHVRLWSHGRFVTLRPGENTGTQRYPAAWGPEVEFSRRWRLDHPGRSLFVVKVTKGWTGLAKDPRELDWSPRSTELYARASAEIRAARHAMGAPGETVVVWHQGERDAADAAKASAYAANLAEFRKRVLADWGFPNVRLIIARINSAKWAGSPVRRVQDAYHAYDTDGFPLQKDRVHLSAEGQVDSGAAAYAAYRRVTDCGPAEGPGRPSKIGQQVDGPIRP